MGGRRLCVPSRRQTFAVRQEYVLERFLLSIGVVRRPTAESTASKRSKRDGEIPVFFQGASLALGPTTDLRLASEKHVDHDVQPHNSRSNNEVRLNEHLRPWTWLDLNYGAFGAIIMRCLLRA